MCERTVRFNEINEIKECVSAACRCNFDIDVVSGRIVIDAKSIMGIFSLDFSQPVELRANCPDGSDFPAKIAPYLVEQ